MKVAKYHGYLENPKFNSIDGKIDAGLKRKRKRQCSRSTRRYIEFEKRRGTLKWKP